MKKRRNGTGSVVYLGKGRYKPYAARLVVGRDVEGKPIYLDIDTFETELDALVCLENYRKTPTPLKIKKARYERIAFFPLHPFSLVPVENINTDMVKELKKDSYTFKSLFEEFEKVKLPNAEEIKIEQETHKKPEGKYAYNYSRGMITAYHNSTSLYDKPYKELRTSDFQNCISECGKKYTSQKQMQNLFMKLDEYALQEDIIDKGYAQYVTVNSNSYTKNEREPFTYEQIEYLWDIKAENYKEDFIRDFLLLTIYTGCRAEELLFIYTKKIFLDKNYFVTGIKTQAGINREIPIHPKIKKIFFKYYNTNNEFLFMMPNGRRTNYDYYLYHYKYNFIEKHPFLKRKTAHCGRHTLRNELEKLNVKQIIINSIIGHSNENVGQDIYSHISIEEKLEAIKMVTYKEKKIYVLSSNS